jgi:hypothetical protein
MYQSQGMQIRGVTPIWYGRLNSPLELMQFWRGLSVSCQEHHWRTHVQGPVGCPRYAPCRVSCPDGTQGQRDYRQATGDPHSHGFGE